MFFTLFSTSYSWTEEALMLGTEFMFRQFDPAKQAFLRAFNQINEKYDPPCVAGGWLARVEYAPTNTKCFNHWRFVQTPINGSDNYHRNKDDLTVQLNGLLGGLINNTITDKWAYNFAFKVASALFFEAFSPLHTSELFDNDRFKDGDDSGKKYMIKYQGNEMSLLDFWDSGCGRYTRQTPYTETQWTDFYKNVDYMLLKFPRPSCNVNITWQMAVNDTLNVTNTVVYQGIKYGQELSKEYIDKCIEITDERLACAAYNYGTLAKTFILPSAVTYPSKHPVSTSEMAAWATLLLLSATFGYLAWYHRSLKR